jgi:hypothetical protein
MAQESSFRMPSYSVYDENPSAVLKLFQVQESEKSESEVVHFNEEIHQSPTSTVIEPLLFIDVNITPTQTERLEVFRGDTPE